MSITPVREALARLAAEGLIDTSSGRTRYVAAMSAREALDVLEVKALLTCTGFEWGLDHLTSGHISRLRAARQEFDAALDCGDLTAAAAARSSFTRVVVSACGNQQLLLQIESLKERSVRAVTHLLVAIDWDMWRSGYREVFEHIEAGDRRAAVHRYRQIYVEHRARLKALLSN